jgi:translation initiation factor 1A
MGIASAFALTERVTRLGHICGKMQKKVWITAGDIVLVGKRDFQDEKVDIVH